MVKAGQHLEKAAMLAVRCGQMDRAADLLHNTLGLYSEAGVGGSQHGGCVIITSKICVYFLGKI